MFPQSHLHSYILAPPFSLFPLSFMTSRSPNLSPISVLAIVDLQPQLVVLPVVRWLVVTTFSPPQSHLQFQVLLRPLVPSRLNTTSLPNRRPTRLLALLDSQPQEIAFFRLLVSTFVSLPQSHEQFQITFPDFVRSSESPKTNNLLNRFPVKSVEFVPKHPHDLVGLFFALSASFLTNFSFPQSHKHRQYIRRVYLFHHPSNPVCC